MIPDFVLLIPFSFSNATLLSFDRILLEFVLHALIDEPSPYYAKLLGWPLRCDLYFFRCLENHLSRFLKWCLVHSTNGFHGFYQIIDPPSFKSSLSTLVTTACLMFMILIERATFLVRPSQRFRVFRFYTANPQERVHTFPNIIKVAVPSPQHSPMGSFLRCKWYSSCICLLSQVLCMAYWKFYLQPFWFSYVEFLAVKYFF
jgi:hypothetical protein